MDPKKLNRLIAVGVFFAALLTYIRTLSPTVVFWDVGEFCAAAFSLQVPHPPGAPLFLLIAKIASLFPIVGDIAVRMHFMSAFSAAAAVAFLYLVTVDLIELWRGVPTTMFDKVVVYGSSVIGALSLAYSKTFWFNAVEAEVYGLSMFFVGLILWLGLRWYERAERDSGDRYLLLIAYIVGLAVGVHLLAILALWPVMLLWYFRNHEFEMKSFMKFMVGATVIFLVIYPGIVKELPSLLDGDFRGTKSDLITVIPIVALIGAAFFVYRSQREKRRLLNVALLGFLLIVLGISTYAMVYIRANAQPPMNENDPSTIGRLVSYLNREQYGSAPMLERRWDADPEKQAYHARYKSDLDYMWRYQIVHMYFRYLGWNYIGSEGDMRDAGVDVKQLLLVPFILGLIGAWYQWKRQPKISFIMIVTFVLMGVLLALYQNQQEPQPRERDYFYVGSYFVFSLWIAFGVLGIIDLLKERVGRQAMGVGAGVLVAAFVFVPANMFRVNFDDADRTGNYVAWDYSYNLLQSCEPDAILFTNGDNDTFPLWYLQDVEAVRRDVRIVNLSLVNTSWYIKQLKHQEPHGAKRVPISLSDAEIADIRPMQYEPRMMELPVGPEVVRRFTTEDKLTIDTAITNNGVLRFYMPHAMEYSGLKLLRAQDIMVYDIVRTNNWQRPVYFAMTVADDGKIGLREYMRLSGLAFKLVPAKANPYWAGIDEQTMRTHIFSAPVQPSLTYQPGFRWRGLADSTVYYDEDTRRLLTNNYRNMFISLALYYSQGNRQEEVAPILDRMEEVIPRGVIPMDYRVKFDVSNLYNSVGREDRFRQLNEELIAELQTIVSRPVTEQLSVYNPYILLFYAYSSLDKYQEAEQVLGTVGTAYASTQGIDQILMQLRMQLEQRKLQAQADSVLKR